MLDFTSALYLDFQHAARDLPNWEQLTLGKPAALEDVPGSAAVERDLATLIGCQRVSLVTSTLHLFWDLFSLLARDKVRIYLDAGSYPIVRWGVEHAAYLGATVHAFPAHDANVLRQSLIRSRGGPPVIVADGYCPMCGSHAPLEAYLAMVRPLGGTVVIDDSQALGIWGAPAPGASYGSGGGGSMRYMGLSADEPVVMGSSLGKAFGVPVAMLGGSARLIAEFESRSATRVHCSPPSSVAVLAAARALALNRRVGDSLRSRLFRLVKRFRNGLTRLGLSIPTGIFPVQTLQLPSGIEAQHLHEELRIAGVSTVLHRSGFGGEPSLSFVITAGRTLWDIDETVSRLACVLTRIQPKAIQRSYGL